MSFWGFQSESKMMTVSAEVRLIPTPPARVERSMTKSEEAGFWYSSIFCRREGGREGGRGCEI
jgi:hypothetical protein